MIRLDRIFRCYLHQVLFQTPQTPEVLEIRLKIGTSEEFSKADTIRLREMVSQAKTGNGPEDQYWLKELQRKIDESQSA